MVKDNQYPNITESSTQHDPSIDTKWRMTEWMQSSPQVMFG